MLLMATWLVFSGQFDAFHVSMGVISAAFVTAFSGEMFFLRRRRTGCWGESGIRFGSLGYLVLAPVGDYSGEPARALPRAPSAGQGVVGAAGRVFQDAA